MAHDATVEQLHYISSVAGRYTLGDRPQIPGVNILACRLRAISERSLIAAAPVAGSVGDAITLRFAPFGTLRGHIARHVADGFVVVLDQTAEAQAALARRIGQFQHRRWTGMTDKRAEKRFMPAEPRSVLIRNNREMLPCLVVDYSACGAAVSAQVQPELGERVMVGQVEADVVRLFDVGFAVHFAEPQAVDDIESLLESPQEWRLAVAVLPPRTADGDDIIEFADLIGFSD
ncbi:hypothetical protein [Devosia sp. FKR38]|uniref:hypothetical protein n=1 Tax=Devosia sp. FKR38 TaxID=2562312 RepID=UPI0010C0FB7D|nr:hypothetical protein [Devosia sp. FKR38]